MLLALDAADRLARLLEERGRVSLDEAANQLLALHRSSGAAISLMRAALAGDARFALTSPGWVEFAPLPAAETPLAGARFAVLDLETSGLSTETGHIVEAACVRVSQGTIVAERMVCSRPKVSDTALEEVMALARGAVVVGHNLSFDIRFLDARLRLLHGARLASPVVDTLALARRLLRGRAERLTLSALADFFGTASTPEHRALPDARATAEVLMALVELALDEGARTVADLCALSR